MIPLVGENDKNADDRFAASERTLNESDKDGRRIKCGKEARR